MQEGGKDGHCCRLVVVAKGSGIVQGEGKIEGTPIAVVGAWD